MGPRGWGGLVQREDTDRVIAMFPRDSLVKLLVEEAMHPGDEPGEAAGPAGDNARDGWMWRVGLL